ncbi:MAG: acid-resistance rane protein [Rickettsiales bacterium]|jgi:uncharacterized membrane protein HdeD (DUF308 family)|nr:acid-resistance rane protein [Rickettsiales bacterium]
MATELFETDQMPNLKNRIPGSIVKHRGWYIFEGVVFVLGGLLSIALPVSTALAFEMYMGVLLLITGLVKALSSIRSHPVGWSAFSSLLLIGAGVLMLWKPVTGMVTLATIVATFLLLEAVTEIMLSFQFRPAKNWNWLMFSGIATLVLAILLFTGWPGNAVVFLGVLIGANLLLYGAALLALSIPK